jgi:hypothetical protein
VLVAGESGVGKSSVCRAGVLPAVAEGALGPEGELATVTLVPGRHPLASLAAAIAPLVELDEIRVASWLEREPERIARLLRQGKAAWSTGGGVLLFVDQLEELLTLAEPAEAAAAAEALGLLALRSARVRLLATGRSDFLTQLAGLPLLGPEIARALFLLPPLSDAGLREAVVSPAAAKGFGFESEAVVEELVSSVGRAIGSGSGTQSRTGCASRWPACRTPTPSRTRPGWTGPGGSRGRGCAPSTSGSGRPAVQTCSVQLLKRARRILLSHAVAIRLAPQRVLASALV